MKLTAWDLDEKKDHKVLGKLWIIVALIWSLFFLLLIGKAEATSYDPGWPDALVCKVNGQENDTVLRYEMKDTDAFHYGRADARSYSIFGSVYVLFDADMSFYGSYGTAECDYNISTLATNSRAFFWSETNTSTPTTATSTITIADDPTRNLYYGFILFFVMFFGLLFYLKPKGGD